MNILLHAETRERPVSFLEKKIRAQLPGLKICHSLGFKDLKGLLSLPMSEISIVVLFIPSLMMLEKCVRIKSLFDGKKLILILPGQVQKMFQRGLELNPSFICDPGRGIEDVLLVLEEIAGKTARSSFGLYS